MIILHIAFELILILYHVVEASKSIFERSDSDKRFKLKDGINFHLYINTAPCGDSRLFSPHEKTEHTFDRHPNRISRGQLRTKIESGEGTIPVKNAIIQTWDGVLQVGKKIKWIEFWKCLWVIF